MRLRKLVALLLALSLCFAAGVVAEGQYHVWQPAKNAGEGYLAQATAGLPGWFNPDTLVAVVAGGLLLTALMRLSSRLRRSRRTSAAPSLRDRVAVQRPGSSRTRARG